MMEDPYARFGVNCFGKKPEQSEEDKAAAAAASAAGEAIPMTEEDKILAAKAQYWKEKGGNILKVNAFNGKSWSEY